MPDLLLELFCEEIPARMQGQAADDLQRLVLDALAVGGLYGAGAAAFATPRRLALHVADLPAAQPDTREERKGPKVGAPEAAVAGFLKSAGLASLDEAKVQSDPKKGDFYVAVIERAGRPTIEVLAEILPAIVEGFPWPKSMRWGAASAASSSLRWVRPLQAILATFGPDTEEPDVVPFAVGGIAASNVTRGHRFMAPDPFTVRRFADYVPALERAKVVLDPARRRDIILHDARTLAMAQGLELVEDEGLLAEVAGLVEWPVALMGEFEAAFLDIPPEVIRATIRANQKCFVLRQSGSQKLANRFVLVANIEASDGGAEIARGNAKVVRARLSDARFFWESDLKVRLDDRVKKLDSIVFHADLGTQGERVARLEKLSADIASLIKADPAEAARAAQLCKADLVTEMVGEFPELQGLMGRYYAAHQGESAAIAAACEEHYKPQGPSDRVPSAPVSIAVALADKLDTLVGFWAIDERPTGSKDPYALRRAALGVIRLILENELRLPILTIGAEALLRNPKLAELPEAEKRALLGSLLGFFAERLKVYLRDTKARHDLIDAVFGAAGSDDFVLVVRRVRALGDFLGTDEGANLLAGYRRAANILRAEAKKAPDEAKHVAEPYDPVQAAEPAERSLAQRLAGVTPEAADAVAREDYEGAMRVLSTLRAPLDTFFDEVTVNAPDPALRLNRLRLLDGFRGAVHAVADFSRIGGEPLPERDDRISLASGWRKRGGRSDLAAEVGNHVGQIARPLRAMLPENAPGRNRLMSAFGCPARHMPAGWAPPVAAFGARFDKLAGALVAALFTTEGDAVHRATAASRLDAWLAGDNPPARVERAEHATRDGARATLTMAYWLDPAVWEAWAAQGFEAWWGDDARLRDPGGHALEVLRIPADRLETIFGHQEPRGATHTGQTLFGPIEEHLYWGAMRDRIPASSEDALASAWGHNLPPKRQEETRGRRLRVGAPQNLCVIRSGQNWGDCDADELAMYDSSVRPALHAGMRYLRDHPDETGCLDLRFANEIEDGQVSKRAFGLGFFLSLGHLEAWAAHHPTHLAIFERMVALGTERGDKLGLKLWHEVFVLPAEGQHFEYVNCAPGTGLLGYFPAT